VSYVIAAYGVTGGTLIAYALYLLRERARERRAVRSAAERDNG